MSGSIAGDYNQSQSRQKQASYGPLGSESGGIRGQGQNILANLLFGREQGRTEGTGFAEGGTLGALFSRSQQTPTYEAPDLMGAVRGAVSPAFSEAVSQAMNKMSGNFGARGFNTPRAVSAIAGSAAQNVAPQFAELFANTAVQDAQGRAQVPLIQEDMARKRFADLLGALGINIQALGGQSEGSSYSKGFGTGGKAEGSMYPSGGGSG